MAFDFSTLPKIRTHANLGRLGDVWDAFTISQAAQELVCEQNVLLEQANAMQALYQSALNEGDLPDEVVFALNQSADDYVSLVQQYSGVMNAYYQATGVSPSGSCPPSGIGISGLSGFGRVNGLGQWQLLIPLAVSALTALGRYVIWDKVFQIIGSIASAFKADSDVKKTNAELAVNYYKDVKIAREHGLPDPPAPPNLNSSSSSQTNIIILAGIAVLGLFVFMRGR
jgi:hypothetical protein